MDTALSFDVDWMRGQSVGIFPISSGNPAPIIAELEKIVDSGENGLSQNVIKFQPVARLNAIMVVSKKPELLHTAATWIKRLDHADTARTSVHVYRVKYGEARQIARVLTDMFIGGSSSGLLDSAITRSRRDPAPPPAPAATVCRRTAAHRRTPTGSARTADRQAAAQPGSARKRRQLQVRAQAAATEPSTAVTPRARAAANRCCRTCGSRPISSTIRC